MVAHTLFIRQFPLIILWTITLCLWSPNIISQEANSESIERLSCQELSQFVEAIFIEDRVETANTTQILPLLFTNIQSKTCDLLPDVMNLQGLEYYNSNEPYDARNVLLQADSLLQLNDNLDSKTNVRNKLYLGLVDQMDLNFVGARVYFEKALRISEKIDFQKGKLQAYLNLSTEQIQNNNPEGARKFLFKASEISQKTNNNLMGGFAYQNLARSYLIEDNIEQALKYTGLAEDVWSQMDYSKGLYFTHLNFSSIYKKSGEPELELSHLHKALYYSEKDNSYSRHHIYLILGNHYSSNSDYSKAKEYFEKALALSNSIGEEEIIDLISKLLDLYERDNEIEKIKQVNANAVKFYKSKSNLFTNEAKRWLEKEINLEKQLEENQVLRKSNTEIISKIKNRNLLVGLLILLVITFVSGGIFQYKASRTKSKLLAQIQNQNEELNRVNEELSLQKETVEVQKEHLEQLDTMKSAFFTNISHEFRTPLTVINGMTESISGNDKQKNLILRNTDNLLKLINQILDLSKLENKSLEVQNVQGDIIKFIRYIIESFHSLSNRNNTIIKLVCKKLNIMMDYDQEKIQHIVSNLLSNAIKHSSSGGQVIVELDKESIRVGDNNKDSLILSVIDKGSGIKESELSKIFDRFYQVDDDVSKAGGTGIGLAFTKELVDLLNGGIEVNSQVGIGSTFTIKLPITNEASLLNEHLDHAAEGNSDLLLSSEVSDHHIQDNLPINQNDKPLLLIIEDNADVVEYLARCLESDYKLLYAYNGRVGIESAIETIPDIIISDVMMPEKDGYEVCNILKQTEETSHIPIILVTAKADIEDKILGLEYGADAYLSKPFNPKELKVRLDKLILSRKLLQEKYSAGSPIKKPEPNSEDVFLIKVQSLIMENLETYNFGPNELAKELAISRSQLHRKLKALTDTSTSNYIMLVKLRAAKNLLINTKMNISEVAYATGFNTLNYFSKSFSKMFNCSPTEFRSS